MSFDKNYYLGISTLDTWDFNITIIGSRVLSDFIHRRQMIYLTKENYFYK